MIAKERNTILVGDVREQLATLPDESVHMVVTSPPYWGLRDYDTASWEGGDEACEHVSGPARNDITAVDLARRAAVYGTGTADGSKVTTIQYRDICGDCGAKRIDAQLGLEPTPEQFVANMVAVFREVKRVLRKDGTVWLNLGDSYANGNKGGYARDRITAEDSLQRSNLGANFVGAPNRQPQEGLKVKDMVGIPWMVAFALRADGWWLRSDVIWSKPNPMPESVTDRPTKSHEYLFLLAKSEKYYYDAEAIREPLSQASLDRISQPNFANQTGGPKDYGPDSNRSMRKTLENFAESPLAGRNRRTVWEIPTQPFAEAHFATFPEALVLPCIQAGTSEHGVCSSCGAPWRRVVEVSDPQGRLGAGYHDHTDDLGVGQRGVPDAAGAPVKRTVGWEPTCGCGCPEGMSPQDFEIVYSPTGRRGGDDPTLLTGRHGMNRPRGENEGQRPITRYQQRRYAEQLKASPFREDMEEQAGDAFAHYIRTDASGARPIPADLLEDWIARGWLADVAMPAWLPAPLARAVVLDPFMGSGTVGLVAKRAGRDYLGCELNPTYAAMAEERIGPQGSLL